ncbi:MAG: type II secretion system F family protein [Patescibacteria group bacterium]
MKLGEKITAFFGRINNITLRVPLQEQAIFVRHLAVTAKAGLPLLESLRIIAKETRSGSLKKIVNQLINDVSNGQFLSASLDKFRNVFGNLFVNIVRVGESAGILPENLNYLAEELKKKRELKRKVVGALVYPAVVVVATFGIVGLLTVFIFPKILPVFSSLKVKLPLSTRILIWLSNALTNYGGYIALGAVALIILLFILTRIKKIKYLAHRFVLALPIFGTMAKAINLSNFCRTLGLTLKSGVQVVEAINITSESLSNLVYKKKLMELSEEIRRGEALSPYFTKHRHLFPPILSQMVAVGESSGNLSDTLLYLAEFYEGEVTDATTNLSNVLEPILMVTMGIVVGFVAISIITPIYEITQSVGH